MTNRQKTSLANRVLNLTEKARTLYQKKDDLFQQLLNGCGTGVAIETKQGRFEIIDNFAAKNVGYRPASFHRFELKEVKTAKAAKKIEAAAPSAVATVTAFMAAPIVAAPVIVAPMESEVAA